ELAREDALRGLHELLFGDVLVHDVAHALASRFGRERDARGARARALVERVLAEAVGAERAHAERDALRREALGDALDERSDARVIRRGQRTERYRVVAALLDRRRERLDDLLRIALAHGPVNHPRLAEAA